MMVLVLAAVVVVVVATVVVAAAVLVAVAVVTEDRPFRSLHLLGSRNTSSATGRSRKSSRTGRVSSRVQGRTRNVVIFGCFIFRSAILNSLERQLD